MGLLFVENSKPRLRWNLLRPELGESHVRVRARRDSIIGEWLKHTLRDLLAHTSILDKLDLILFLLGRS